ncbi:ABC transporter ATP-binding protein/permease [Oculatella sp. LEGE 06141]|uniref:ABC transporter ATP-binding protein n=1 Tax=Oculatella sp. LEGE 06141 TaxID=1828648 RepID=UPI0018811DC6|nr:ABC transporter ATP-binding protein/permease [Oculatella sp. LEGE 06141]MBE9179718.1 ABC transporter ATP-binding protein/permease [Oculatella sp. LEGE 06141]
MIKYLAKVLYVLTGTKRELIFLSLLFIFTSVIEAVGIGLIGPFLNLASEPDAVFNQAYLAWAYEALNLQSTDQFILLLGVGIIFLFCLKSASYFLVRSYIFRYTFDQKRQQMSRLLKAYLIVPYPFHLSRNTANLIKNIILETNQFTLNCLQPLLESAANLVVIIALLLLLAQTNLLLLVMILGILLPTFVLFYSMGNKFRRWGKIASEAQQEMLRAINHGLGGLKETRVIGCETYFQQQMDRHSLKYESAATRFQSSQLIPRILIETTLVAFVIIFVIYQFFVGDGMEDFTSVMGVFAVASLRLIPTASQFTQAIGRLRNSSYSLDMLYHDLKEIEQEKLDPRLESALETNGHSANYRDADPHSIMAFKHRVELKQVAYRYPKGTDLVLTDVSLEIPKGSSIALIGKSGAGKTTLVDVILGLLTPESGDIQVDGVSVYNDLRSWQNLIGYIPQTIFLTDDTVERNIAFGVPDEQIDSDRLMKAIQAAQLEELVAELPQGVKTDIGERGVRLSGGQRQRIGIARALYHEREILVLDEATAALDNETEYLVSEAIRALSGTKTLIIIAHRLSTVEHCDCVYLMEKGQVVKSGSYQEVVLQK